MNLHVSLGSHHDFYRSHTTMYNNQSITQIFSLLCFLGAVTLVVLDVLVPDESRSSRNPQGAEPAGSSPSLLSLLDIPVTTGLNTLGGFRPPVTAPASSGERSSDTVRLVVSLSQRQVALYRGDSRKAEYPVAIGQTGWETPTGAFEVIETQKYPTWEHPLTGERIPPGPRNPLGDRWIGFLDRWPGLCWLSRYGGRVFHWGGCFPWLFTSVEYPYSGVI